MTGLSDLKIRHKLTAIILGVTITIVLLNGVVELFLQSNIEKESLKNQISALAELIGDRSDAALAFEDASLASDNLAALSAIPQILYACLYREDATVIAKYTRTSFKNSQCPGKERLLEGDLFYEQNGLHFSQLITRGGQTLGWLHIASDLSAVEKRFNQQIIITLLAFLLAVVVGVLIAGRLQRIISRPIENITEVADRIEEHGELSIRVHNDSNDEVGRLARSFNNMLDALEQNKQQLISAKDEQLAAFSLYRNLIESTSAIPWEMDPQIMAFTFVGHQAEQLFGYPMEAWYREGFLEKHIHVDDRGELEAIRAALSQRDNHKADLRIYAVTGRTVWVHIEAKVIAGHGGPERLQGFMLDVSEVREYEEVLKSIAAGVSSGTGEAFFQDLVQKLAVLFNVNCVSISVFNSQDDNVMDTLALCIDKNIVENGRYKIAGTPREEVLGKEICVYETNLRQHFPKDHFLDEINADFYVGLPLQDSKGMLLGILDVMHEEALPNVHRLLEVMTIFASRAAAEIERLASDKRLRAKEYEQRQMIDSMLDGVVTIDDSGIILSFNKAAEKMFGYTALEIIGQQVKRLMPDQYAQHHDDFINNYLTTGQAKLIGTGRDVHGMRKDGEMFPIRISIAELPTTINGKRRFIASCMDLSLIRNQEEMLRRSQRMDALGKLTGGVAHDFNNMLGIILGYSDMLSGMLKENPKLQHYASEIKHAGERGAKLTKKLLSFSRVSSSDRSITDINKVLIEQQHMLERSLTSRIDLVYDLEKSLWPVNIDRSDFEDVILNMAINAMHSIDGTGSIKFETRNTTLDALQASRFNLLAGQYVQLSISDTGIGMDDATRERIFDPFYSTKGDMGTGLGLTQVYGFVQRSSGTISVTSEPGTGSAFTLMFPVADSQSEWEGHVNDSSLSESELTGSETILVVDDEPALLSLAGEILTDRGYHVFLAQDARQAIELLKDEKIDLVVSDVIMPEMDGFELADHINNHYPHIKIQLVSGYSDDNAAHATDQLLYKNLLRKPLQSNILLRRIRELLD